MSDTSQGPGWWVASDGKWYAPELHPNAPTSPRTPTGVMVGERANESPRFCPGCGAERIPGAPFCASCGHALTLQGEGAGGSATQQSEPSVSSSAPPAVATAPRVAASGPNLPPGPGAYGPLPNQAQALGNSQISVPTNSTATLALVFAILIWPVGIILGHIARRKVRQTGERGAGLALAALIVGYAWGALVIIIVIGALAAAPATGFNDLSTLESSVTQQVNANLNNPSNAAYSPGTSVSSTICVHNSGTQYSCVVRLSGGTTVPVSVTVSTDGSRWVSTG